MNLTNYFWYFKSAVPSRICDEIVKYSKSIQDGMATTGGYGDPKKLNQKQLKDLKVKALDVVMESGTPDSLAIALNEVSKKIGLTWNTDVQALPNFKQAS